MKVDRLTRAMSGLSSDASLFDVNRCDGVDKGCGVPLKPWRHAL